MNCIKILVIPFLLLLNEICFSQVKLEWEKKYGKKDYNYNSNSIIQTRDSGYILVGEKSKSFSSNELLIIKLDSNGELVWEKTFGTYSSVRGNSIIQLKDGGYAITGLRREKDYGEFMWLFKIDSLGNMVWEYVFGETLWNEGIVVKTNSSDEIIVSGIISSNKYNTQNVFLTKFSSKGNLIWGRLYEKKELELVSDLAIAENGTIYAFGVQKTKNYKGFFKIINSNGEIINEYIYNFSKKNIRVKGIIDSDSSLLLLGNTINQKNDFLLLRVSLKGDIIWEKTIGTKKDDYPFGISKLATGNIILTGYTSAKGNGSYDGWLVEVDKAGNLLHELFLGGKLADLILSAEKTYDNGIIVSGYTISEGIDNSNVWIIKLK